MALHSPCTGEVLGARWDEIDLAEQTWTIPAARMKAGKEHRVPLCDAAIAVLDAMAGLRLGDHVFPGRNGPLGGMAMRRVLAALRPEVSVHGFRSTFRDWAGEATAYPREVAEAALAHAIGNQVETAYRHGDLFEKRRALMRDWAQRCAGGAIVLPLRRIEA
jgi:integrase